MGGYQLSSTPSSGRGKLWLFSSTKKTSLSAPPQSISSLSLSGDATGCKFKHLNLLCAQKQVRVASPTGLGPFQPGSAPLAVDAALHRHRFLPFHTPRVWQDIPSTCTPRRRSHLAQVNQLCPALGTLPSPMELHNPEVGKPLQNHRVHPDTAVTTQPCPQRHTRTLCDTPKARCLPQRPSQPRYLSGKWLSLCWGRPCFLRWLDELLAEGMCASIAPGVRAAAAAATSCRARSRSGDSRGQR